MNDEWEKIWKEVIVVFEVLSQYLPGRTEEGHEKPQDSRSRGRIMDLAEGGVV
jgi:hypothetical protein